MMKRTICIALAAIGMAMAQSPHFLKADADVNNTGQLVVTFKEAGLGNTLASAVITARATCTAEYGCFNRGGNHPQAANKETVTSDLSASGTFPVRNGSVTGSLTISPVGPGNFTCPGGQTLQLISVTYTNVSVSGEGATAAIPGVFTF